MDTPPPRPSINFLRIPRPAPPSSDSDYDRGRRRRYLERSATPPNLRPFEELEDSSDFARDVERQIEQQRKIDTERQMRKEIDKFVEKMSGEDWLFNPGGIPYTCTRTLL
mmetsp:Transcript_27109/g.48639  ORF Transcript_27109/g.48639 Transcript_27109/m.48639 type:complete len:110 (+) Transcript_27109:376-705(+)|eukprot:CAMPEP_0204910032 /NCGR_PEP_ID=MMETSP1397-20131031/8634_1 /ASSEMBLY_ACC=CAM_ASM_000891 /TAXON_ID=49980 /ORGANISM="Climacostomum Climacostomum virens, Strain Stock W-24" /LENGTH=109 /DNA_ID=CAMNT_0052080045 /DNA_START=291 /DNA_END=620 /DNA_ORIENTATION=+